MPSLRRRPARWSSCATLAAVPAAAPIVASRTPLPCTRAAFRMIDHLKEKKEPDFAIGARVDELRRYHRSYKKAFVRSEAMSSACPLPARPRPTYAGVHGQRELKCPCHPGVMRSRRAAARPSARRRRGRAL